MYGGTCLHFYREQASDLSSLSSTRIELFVHDLPGTYAVDYHVIFLGDGGVCDLLAAPRLS